MSRLPGNGSTTIVAVDTGGTFTDLVALDGLDRIRTAKVPSTPDDPSRAILAGLDRLLPEGGEVVVLHGSTVATNALLERAGARVLLVTTEGFEDVLEIGRQNRPQLYAFEPHRPPPLVPADDRVGVAGRLGPEGEEIDPLDLAAVEALLDRATEADAVAIVGLHSYTNDAHERAVADVLRPTGTPLSISADVLPEFREYERTATTVVNAYVQPIMQRYLGNLRTALTAKDAPVRAERLEIMGSAGGLLPVDRAVRAPVHTVLSGPAGGVVGALAWAQAVGRAGVVTFDMGGTSTDVSLCPGHPLRTREFEIAGVPVAIPVLDIHTVGAGGGSIARVDAGGALRVGPESAGADPGPICYGRGGTEVTVTDAHVWLGRIPTDAFAAGDNALDRAAIEAPLTRLAYALGTSLEEAALGVLEVATTTMERALRVISVERGFDPADLALVAFGGAGGLHAADLSVRLGCAEALVPPASGLLSAWGILAAPPVHEVSRSVLRPIDDVELPQIRDELTAAARAVLEAEGVPAEETEVEAHVDLRYRGQSFELRVPAEGSGTEWAEAFHSSHQQRYGYARRDRGVEAVTLRAVARGRARELVEATVEAAAPGRTNRPAVSRILLNGTAHDPPVIHRAQLSDDSAQSGPLTVIDDSATTWVPDGFEVRAHESGVLRLRRLPG